MSKHMKQSILTLSLWGLVGILFLIILLSTDAIANWSDNRIKSALLAALFFVGFLSDFILKHVFNKKRVLSDERDQLVVKDAATSSFIIVIIYVFIFTISLFLKYEVVGVVPVGWLWVIAYSLIVVSNVVYALMTIIAYKKRGS